MTESIEPLIRFGVFLVVLLIMLLWEWRQPFRCFVQPKFQRLYTNLGLMGINFIVLRLLSGGGAFFMAQYVSNHGFGLLHIFPVPDWLNIVISLIVLDFAIYLQHIVFHRVPAFWRLHRVHHCDVGFDTSTGVRFHPLEILLSMYYKMLLVVLLGPSPEAVILFEIILNACALFNHGNVRILKPWESRLRVLLITPDMHRIHHSSNPVETNSNYGFSVPWWDRVCGTYPV